MTSDLTTQLRAARPVAPPELRERVRAIASQENPQRTALPFGRIRIPRLRFAVVPVAAALVLLSSALVFGLARSGSHEAVRTDLDGATTTVGKAAESAPGSTGNAPMRGALVPGPADQSLSIAPDQRAQRVAATLTVEVHDSNAVSQASQDALDLTRSLGGHIVSASVATGDEASDRGSASLTVRVPVARVQEAIVGLSALGKITSQKVTVDDLQEGLDQLERRAASVRKQIVRITARLESEDLDAETTLSLEARRQALRSELRQLRQGVASTKDEASMATIQLAIVTPGASGVVPVPSRFDRTIHESLNILLWEAVVALAALVVIAPFALALLAVWLGRRLYRRQEEQLLAAH